MEVGKRLSGILRKRDSVARLGGDEFVVLLEGLSLSALEAAAQSKIVGEKILKIIAQPYEIKGYIFNCTASIGVSLYNRGDRIEDLLQHADFAMYESKKSGRNALRFFDQNMQLMVSARVTMDADLRCALDQHQFALHYQAQVSQYGKIVGAEVLLRWEHPERGLVSPVEFIPLAEETGLILAIGQWVLEMACAQLKAWECNAHTRDLQLSVNVSAHQFHQTNFVSLVQLALSNHATNPKLLKLEITESIVLENIEDTIVKMNALMDFGICCSMDDFGTGFSSLTYLTQLPFKQLKIDQSFVRNIGIKPRDDVIVKTITLMASSLEMEVIAEGVETESQRDFLEKNDCFLFQGYLFSA